MAAVPCSELLDRAVRLIDVLDLLVGKLHKLVGQSLGNDHVRVVLPTEGAVLGLDSLHGVGGADPKNGVVLFRVGDEKIRDALGIGRSDAKNPLGRFEQPLFFWVQHTIGHRNAVEDLEHAEQHLGAMEKGLVELLSELQFDPLIDFAEEYLEAGEALLTELHKQRLHRLLAIGYAVRENRSKALAHLEKSDLQLAELEKIREQFREVGVGVRH